MRSVFLIALLTSLNVFAADVKIITEEAPPLQYMEKGKITGVAVGIVEEMMNRMKLKTKIEVLPWARGYDMVQKDANVALFSTTRTPERESLFKWVGPLASKDWVFIAKSDSKLVINSVEDAKKVKTIGAYREDAKEQYLKSIGFTNLDSVAADNFNVKKLHSGRIDLWITGKGDLASLVASEKMDMKDFKVLYLVKQMHLHIAFSKATDDKVVKQWQDAYDSMEKDGTLAKIRAKFPDAN